jgi:hypothetical protein
MLALAERNKASLGEAAANVRFLRGEIEAIPCPTVSGRDHLKLRDQPVGLDKDAVFVARGFPRAAADRRRSVPPGEGCPSPARLVLSRRWRPVCCPCRSRAHGSLAAGSRLAQRLRDQAPTGRIDRGPRFRPEVQIQARAEQGRKVAPHRREGRRRGHDTGGGGRDRDRGAKEDQAPPRGRQQGQADGDQVRNDQPDGRLAAKLASAEKHIATSSTPLILADPSRQRIGQMANLDVGQEANSEWRPGDSPSVQYGIGQLTNAPPSRM